MSLSGNLQSIILVINAAMLGLIAWMFDGFTIAGFWPAVFGALVVSVTGWLASYFIGPRGRIEVIVVRQLSRARDRIMCGCRVSAHRHVAAFRWNRNNHDQINKLKMNSVQLGFSLGGIPLSRK